MPPPPGAASRQAAGAVRWGRTRSTSTRRSRACGWRSTERRTGKRGDDRMRNTMKLGLAIALLAIAVAVAACGGSSGSDSDEDIGKVDSDKLACGMASGKPADGKPIK